MAAKVVTLVGHATTPIYYTASEFASAGIVHGMTGGDFDLKSEEACGNFRELFGATKIILLHQVHGSGVCDLRGMTKEMIASYAPVEADACVLHRSSAAPYIAAIKSADCVPVVLVQGDLCALIHAGWRGLAAGIITQVVTRYFNRKAATHALIGPCAHVESYEVGSEVIEAFKEKNYVAREDGKGKWCLDLPASTTLQLEGALDSVQIAQAASCTMKDTRFNSYRRDGAQSGRNLTFLVTKS